MRFRRFTKTGGEFVRADFADVEVSGVGLLPDRATFAAHTEGRKVLDALFCELPLRKFPDYKNRGLN